jgi:hypothetical protein
MPSKTVTGADFVRGYGGRELEEDVFEYLLERHLARG